MRITRRKFLETTTLAGAAALQLNGTAAGQKARRRGVVGADSADQLSRLTWASFYPYINTSFQFTDKDGREVALSLTGMTDTKPADFKAASPGEECFAMTFSGPARGRLTQDTYSVSHFALGNFSLFITDGGSGKRNSIYTAVINRIVS